MKILIIADIPTHPTTAGNRQVLLKQIEYLKSIGHVVKFLYISYRTKDLKKPLDSLHSMKSYFGDDFIFFETGIIHHIKERFLIRLRNITNKGRISCDDKYPNSLTGFVEKINKVEKFDCCIVNYYYLTKVFESIDIPKKVLFSHDYFAYKDLLLNKRNFYLSTDANSEALACQRSNNILALNTEEAIYFSKLSPQSNVFNIFALYDTYSTPIVGNHSLLFFSGPNIFNVNGLKWFVSEIFPLIVKSIPDAELVIGGGICSKIRCYESTNIKLLGYVEKPADFYCKGDIVINPTIQGTGLKIKTFEALSYNKIVMSHPHSRIGIYDESHAPLFSSDKPIEWVNFLNLIWNDRLKLQKLKVDTFEYMGHMQDFVRSEYDRLLS